MERVSYGSSMDPTQGQSVRLLLSLSHSQLTVIAGKMLRISSSIAALFLYNQGTLIVGKTLRISSSFADLSQNPTNLHPVRRSANDLR
ncbi:hypothetical protein MRB53_030505 [Persea americana]|uniref:Uncharacterized protein n=1 Tax=Persea americana TaxID=3435 RepID=A0ACC2KLI7_PERAE|nr:hypothetical protein MRB53_030505 [Persea americana]